MMHSYTLRADSETALLALLEAAQQGKPRPFVFVEEGVRTVDPARITFPRPEMTAGEPYVDEASGEEITPLMATGFWLCEVRLDTADADLAARAE